MMKHNTKEFMSNPSALTAYINFNLNKIKTGLGTKCTFIAYHRQGEEYFIRCIVDGEEIYVAMGGEPIDANDESYEKLLKQLKRYVENK